MEPAQKIGSAAWRTAAGLAKVLRGSGQVSFLASKGVKAIPRMEALNLSKQALGLNGLAPGAKLQPKFVESLPKPDLEISSASLARARRGILFRGDNTSRGPFESGYSKVYTHGTPSIGVAQHYGDMHRNGLEGISRIHAFRPAAAGRQRYFPDFSLEDLRPADLGKVLAHQRGGMRLGLADRLGSHLDSVLNRRSPVYGTSWSSASKDLANPFRAVADLVRGRKPVLLRPVRPSNRNPLVYETPIERGVNKPMGSWITENPVNSGGRVSAWNESTLPGKPRGILREALRSVPLT